MAAADTGGGAASGSWSAKVGPAPTIYTASLGASSWSASADSVSLTVAGHGMGAGMCETTYFDWGLNNPSVHYDARAVRTCRSGTSLSRTFTDSYDRLVGVEKLGVCYAADNTTTSGSGHSCAEYPGRTSSISSINPLLRTEPVECAPSSGRSDSRLALLSRRSTRTP